MKANSERFSGIQGLILSFVDKSTKSIYTEDMEQTEKIMKFFMITGKWKTGDQTEIPVYERI